MCKAIKQCILWCSHGSWGALRGLFCIAEIAPMRKRGSVLTLQFIFALVIWEEVRERARRGPHVL